MGLLEQQNFLARLFTDESLRLSFWENPEIVGKENGLDDSEIAQLKKIIAEDLNYFANSLFHKRLHEVEKLLPLTKRALDKDFSKLFKQFSQTFQPSSVKKHLEDAIEFCKYLQKTQDFPAKDTAKFEQTRHEFFSRQKNFSICFLFYDVLSLKKRVRLAVWYRIEKETRHFYL